MIAPLVPYAIRGVDLVSGRVATPASAQAYKYRRLFGGDDPGLAQSLGRKAISRSCSCNWRTSRQPCWPVLRESQTETLRLANTGMAVTIDIGESNDIHPKNKQDVGKRLALAALHVAYGQSVEYSGPVFQQATPEGGAMRVYLTHADGMQARGGGAITGFRSPAPTATFVPAEVEGGRQHDRGDRARRSRVPAAVRYAWADDPVCNLVNQVGLPAGPFRSDQPRN